MNSTPSQGAPYRRILALDFETAWDRNTYSLSKMTTEEYLRDPRFKAWGCAYQYVDDYSGKPKWVSRADLPAFFNSIDWSTTAALAHNAQFDVSILAWHYGHVPCFILDTLSMARALYGVEVGNSLAKLAERFGLPPKGTATHSTDGILDELPPEVEAELGGYCEHDAALCLAIYDKLIAGYPTKELRLIDATLRMFVQPVLQLDKQLLVDAIYEEKTRRETLLQKLKVTDVELASNDKFAEVLTNMGIDPPMKISRTTGKPAYAFAKNDALFQALMNHEREDISLLCEARLAVKSTLERTRGQRFLDIAKRGTLPVPLRYYAAHTGRWGGSDGLNMQNLRRTGPLRRAVMAPEGYVLVVADLAQIEPRVLAWLSDYKALLQDFSRGGDPYATFGAQMFGVKGLTKESHPDLRQSAKSALLGCFGAQTPVLTQRGWVPIIQVHNQDLLWDGEQWVQHRGVVAQGEKEVLTAHGVSATSDHEILTEHGWVEWNEALTNASLFQSALSLGNLPALNGTAEIMRITQRCAVRADGKEVLIGTTSFAEQLRVAPNVLDVKELKLGGSRKGISRCAPTTPIGTGCWIESAPSSCVVPTQKAPSIRTMAGGALRFIKAGFQTVCNFFSTSSLFPAGTNPRFNLIASTTSRGISPATFAFAPAVKTERTRGGTQPEQSKSSTSESPYLKQRMQTYDIAYAGARNRYTILTNAGPIVVHNCGYGLGWASFAGQLLTGFLGAPPVLYGISFAKQLGIRADVVQAFMQESGVAERMQSIPRVCTNDELALHCCITKALVDRYRNAARPVVHFWRLCDDYINKCLGEDSGGRIRHKCLTFKPGEVVLPNGLSLRYPDLQGRPDEKGWVQWTYGYGPDRKKLYGGKLTENIVQAVARIVMTDGILRVQKRYPCKMTSHDEGTFLVPEAEAEEAKRWIREQMIVEPKYLRGIPLDAKVGAGKRYGDAK